MATDKKISQLDAGDPAETSDLLPIARPDGSGGFDNFKITAGSIADLSSPLTTKGDIFTYSTSDDRLGVGTNGQVLSADSAEAVGLKWIDPESAPLTTKGDLFTYSTVDARIGVGTDGQVLSADSVETTGLKWIDPESAPLTTKGDLFAFSTVDERLPVGTNGQVLTADSVETTGLKWVDPFTGMDKVYVTGGYQEVAPNTIYYTDSISKVIFQLPAVFPRGSTFQIIGASQSQIGWELWTQLGQSLIYQNVITDLAPNIFAFARSSYYRDTATFTCITANTEIQCVEYDGSALEIYQETALDTPLTTVGTVPGLVFAFGKIISTYNGYLAKVFRQSDGAIAFVSPDFANRASQLSELDVGGKLADWALGSSIRVQMMDQSGNAFHATDSGTALWIDSAGNLSSIDSRSAFQTTTSGNNYMQALFGYSGTTFTIMSLATRWADSDESSIATLYDPANGDDYATPLSNVCFYENIANTDFISLRNGNLSTKSIPAINTRMNVVNLFDGANNTMSINGVNGTTVASSGAFSFSKLLMGARYVSGGITQPGNYRVGFMAIYPAALSAGEISDLSAYVNTYL